MTSSQQTQQYSALRAEELGKDLIESIDLDASGHSIENMCRHVVLDTLFYKDTNGKRQPAGHLIGFEDGAIGFLRDQDWRVLSQSTQDRLRSRSLQVVPVEDGPSVEVEDANSRNGKKKVTMKRYQRLLADA